VADVIDRDTDTPKAAQDRLAEPGLTFS